MRPTLLCPPVRSEGHAVAADAARMDGADVAGHPAVSGGRLVFLDGIRALAAIAVVFHHGYQTVTSEGSLRGGLSILGHGNFAVAVFIVLSGFSLAVAASRRTQAQRFGAFIRRRAWRIIPTYLAALVLSTLLIGTLIGAPTGTPWDLALPLSWTGVVVNAFLLQDVFQVRAPNHVLWSIAVEWHLYFLFPLLLAFGRRVPRWCLLVVAALGCALLWPAYGGQPYIGFPPQFFGLFVVGVVAGDIASDRRSGSANSSRRFRSAWTAVALVLAVPLALLLVRVDPTYFTSELILGCAVAAFLITLATGTIDYPARRALEWRPLAWVGLFSYSLYLTHAPVLQIVWQYGVRPIRLGPDAELALTIVAATAASLAFAFGFHLLFERPFLNHRSARALAGALRRRALALHPRRLASLGAAEGNPGPGDAGEPLPLPLPTTAAPLPSAGAVLPAPTLAPGVPNHRWTRDALSTTAIALMVTTVTTSGLGVLFWAGASRLYTPERLGEDAALISAMMLLSIVSQLNLSMGITRLLPQVTHRRWRPVVGAYGLATFVGLAVTGTFVIVAPRVVPSLSFLADDPVFGLALIVGVMLWSIFALQDAVLTSSRWAIALPVENGLFGALKVGLMVALAHSVLGSHGIFVAWLLAMAIMLVPVNSLIFWKVLPATARQRPEQMETVLPIQDRRRVTRYLATDYLAALLSQGYIALLPLLVVAILGRAANAYFYIAFLIVAATGELSRSLSTSMIVEGAHDESDLPSLVRRSIVFYLKFLLPGVAVLVIAAPLLLWPFGAEYVAEGTTLLRVLLVGTIPQAVITLYLGMERVRAEVGRILMVEAAIVALVTTGGILGMQRYGLIGMGLSWSLAHLIVAVSVLPCLRNVCTGGQRRSTPLRMASAA